MNLLTARPAKKAIPILRLVALLMLGATTVALRPGIAEEAKRSVTERASLLARSGHTEEAVQLLQGALAAQPSDLKARLALADLYARNREADKAEQEFREALRLHPDSGSAALGLGNFYADAGSLDAAEQVLGNAVRRHPQQIEARTQLALVLAREHKYAEAEADLHMIPPPSDPKARVRYFRLAASIHSGLGDSHAAAHAMEEASQSAPADHELQLIAAVAESQAGEWSACIRNVAPLFRKQPEANSGLILLRAQLATHENFMPTLQTLRSLNLPEEQKLNLRIRCAEILASADKHAQAVEELQEALRIAGGGDGTLVYNLAVEQYGSGKYEEAFAALSPLRAQKDSAEIEDLIGDIEERRGNRSAAVHSHETAISVAPGEERYRLSLGAELLQYQAYERAVSVFREAAELFPNSARIYVGLGMAYYFMEKYDESVSAFLRADQLDPGSGRAINYLGATQVNSSAGPVPAAVNAICGRADSKPAESATVTWCAALLFRRAFLAGNQSAAPDVIRRLRNATHLAPGDPVASCSLGRALAWTEQLTEARHWLEICVRLRPNSPEDHYRLSRVYHELGLTEAAAEQADLTSKMNAEQDLQQDMANKFAHEMVGQFKSGADPK